MGIGCECLSSAEIPSSDVGSELVAETPVLFPAPSQLGYQLADTTAATLYAFGMSFALCALIDHIPGLHLRASENQIERGLDEEETLELFGEREDEFEERDALERSDGSRRAMATPREEEERKDPPSGCKGEMEITVAELHP